MQPWRASTACTTLIALTVACSSPTPPSQPTSRSPAPVPTQTPISTPTGVLSSVNVTVPQGMSAAPLDRPRKAFVPEGWTFAVWARVPKARLMGWAPDGSLLVSVPATGKIVRLAPNADTGTATASVLLDGLTQPHGVAVVADALYVAESDRLTRYRYVDGAALDPVTVADGLPDARSTELGGAYAHALKSVAVGSDGALYFSIGSTGNVSAEDRTATPPRATIMRIPPGGGEPAVFATGVRNGTGLAFAPDGTLWTAVNNRDDVAYPNAGPEYGKVITEYVNEHPPESVARLTPGRELGWPYCNPDTGPGTHFVRDVQTNAHGTKLDCESLAPVEQTLGAHSAPLGLAFTENTLPEPYSAGALIGIHGSWNRTPQRSPEVAFLPWDGSSLGSAQTLVTGFQDDNGRRWGRPVGAIVGPDGAVYVTDDYAGAVYRLTPPGR